MFNKEMAVNLLNDGIIHAYEEYLSLDEYIIFLAKSTRNTNTIQILNEVVSMTNEEKKKYIAKLIYDGHLTPFEFIDFTFHVTDISRVAVQQLTRHRIASYLQESFRHSEVKNFLLPEETYIEMNLKEEYQEYLDKGMEKDKARYILPMGSLTNIIFKMNLRSLYNFFNLRLCEKASDEIKQLAYMMVDEIKEYYSEEDIVYDFLIDFFKPRCAWTGRCRTPCYKYKENIRFYNERFSFK